MAKTFLDDHYVRFGVLKVWGAKIMLFLEALPLSLVGQFEGFGASCRFQLQVSRMMLCTKRHSVATHKSLHEYYN